MEKDLFLLLIQGIQQHKYENFFNKPGKIRHSSVAIILRINPQCINSKEFYSQNYQLIKPNIENPGESITSYQKLQQILEDKKINNDNNQNLLQVIFIQRAINPNDIHSGQLAFPGGQCDGNENDFQATVREVKEEIGVDLLQEPSIYLGKLPKSFYLRKTKKLENLYVSMHFFLLLSEQDVKFELSKDEVADVQWINFNYLTNPQKERFQKLRVPTGSFYANYVPSFARNIAKNALLHYQYGEYQSIDIGMKTVLWGMTFFIIVYMNSLILYMNDKFKKKLNLQFLQDFVEQSSYFRVQFDENYKFGTIFSYIIRKIYVKTRVQQFSYKYQIEGKKSKLFYEIPIYSCAILFGAALCYYYKWPKISL